MCIGPRSESGASAPQAAKAGDYLTAALVLLARGVAELVLDVFDRIENPAVNIDEAIAGLRPDKDGDLRLTARPWVRDAEHRRRAKRQQENDQRVFHLGSLSA